MKQEFQWATSPKQIHRLLRRGFLPICYWRGGKLSFHSILMSRPAPALSYRVRVGIGIAVILSLVGMALGCSVTALEASNAEFRNGGPAASDCNRDAIPPFPATIG